jgi:hypothetical protein
MRMTNVKIESSIIPPEYLLETSEELFEEK